MGKHKDKDRDPDASSGKKKSKKHKKHKKKHSKSINSDHEEIDVVNDDLLSSQDEGKNMFKLKIKFGGRTLSTAEVVSDNAASEELADEDNNENGKRIASKAIDKREEDRWLEALEKGELDDSGGLKKAKDKSLMTARQRALRGEKKDADFGLMQLPMYPEKTEEETEEFERKRQLRAKKRKQQMKQQIEETKTQTIEKLLTKSQKIAKKDNKANQEDTPHVRYSNKSDGINLSYTVGLADPFQKRIVRNKYIKRVFVNNIMEEEKIIEISKDVDKEEHLLPVHFLPEGNKCYDWIKQDLEKGEKNKERSIRMRKEEDKPPDTCKGKASTVNTVVYHQAHISGELSQSSEKELKRKLLSAAEKGDLDGVKDILKTNPLIINKTDTDGYTALHRACYSGHLDMVVLLLERGGNIHSATDDGWQPLHCAVRWSNLEICKRLIDKKANVNALTNGRQTPLHLAAISSESQPILEMLLLQPSININIQNAAGDTPYDIAHRSGLQYKLFDMVNEGLKI